MADPIALSNLGIGLVDGIDEHQTPLGGFIKSEGFGYRRGYPRSTYGRQKKTAAEIRSTKRWRDGLRWVRADGTERYYSLIDGGIFEGTAPTAFATLRSKLDLSYDPGTGDADTCTISVSGTTVTVSGGTPKCLLTIQAGDYFYTTSVGAAVLVASVTNDTTFEITDPGGTFDGTGPGVAFVIWRKLTDTADSNLIVAGDRLWVFDGANRPHWYDGTHFRVAGLPAPAAKPTVVLAATGALTAGDYFWSYAYEDADGRLSAVVTTAPYTAATDDKTTLAAFVNGPAWATKVSVFRTIADGSIAYCIHPDVTAKLKTSTYSDPSSTLTLADDAFTLVTNMHVDRYVKFATSETSYLITANDGTTITVTGDASSATGGEAGDDYISITGGFDIDQVVAGSVIDIVDDDDLDTDHEAPTHNTQPPAKLMYPHLFMGGGRMCAYKDASQTEVYFSGRSTSATTPTGDATAGLGEFDYWHTSHYAGRQEGDEIKGFIDIGTRTFALKEHSVWQLYGPAETDDVAEYSWFPVSKTVGCLAPRSVVTMADIGFWLGHDGEQVDVIRFDGNTAEGMFRQQDYRLGGPRLRATLDSISSANIAEATAAFFEGRLYVSFPTSSTNNKTLRFDFKTFTADVQPWGCGVFAPTYYDSTDGYVLLCGDPTTVGYVYRVLGTQADNAVDIARELVTGRIRYPGVPTKTRWIEVFMRVVNGEALAAAPVLSYSVDKYAFDSGSKTWETTVLGDAWPQTIGEHIRRCRIEAGEYSEDLMLKITSTEDEDWGVKEIEVRGIPYDQHHSMS